MFPGRPVLDQGAVREETLPLLEYGEVLQCAYVSVTREERLRLVFRAVWAGGSEENKVAPSGLTKSPHLLTIAGNSFSLAW